MGEEKFKEWFAAFKDNLARTPVGNDRNQVKAVYEGICDIAIANTLINCFNLISIISNWCSC
jgi:iron(III) transport system substrate-binding protein